MPLASTIPGVTLRICIHTHINTHMYLYTCTYIFLLIFTQTCIHIHIFSSTLFSPLLPVVLTLHIRTSNVGMPCECSSPEQWPLGSLNNTLPHTATQCQSPQHTESHCITLQRCATLCNIWGVRSHLSIGRLSRSSVECTLIPLHLCYIIYGTLFGMRCMCMWCTLFLHICLHLLFCVVYFFHTQ